VLARADGAAHSLMDDVVLGGGPQLPTVLRVATPLQKSVGAPLKTTLLRTRGADISIHRVALALGGQRTTTAGHSIPPCHPGL